MKCERCGFDPDNPPVDGLQAGARVRVRQLGRKGVVEAVDAQGVMVRMDVALGSNGRSIILAPDDLEVIG